MKFTSQITFLYYQDMDKAIKFFEEVLELKLVMDQGFARVYQIKDQAYIGCVKKKEGSIDASNKGGALISINTTNVEEAYKHVSRFDLPYISKIELIEKIPLRSFFFKDYEGYDFEIQQFVNQVDLDLFS